MNEIEQIAEQRNSLDTVVSKIRELRKHYPFQFFAHLDFEVDPVSPNVAMKMASGWLVHHSRRNGAHIQAVMGGEPMVTGKRQCVHVWIGSDRKLRVVDLLRSWKHGRRTKINPWNQFLDERGADYIVGKHLSQDATQLFSKTFCPGISPCSTKKGRIYCTHAHRVIGV